MIAAALGNFDGVHTAHKAVLSKAAECENSVCVLFKEHPMKVLKGTSPKLILSNENTEKKILEAGIKNICYLDFAQIKDYEPEKFFYEILVEKIGVNIISCGYNYTFGKDRRGDVSLLKKLCDENGIELFALSEVEFEREAISSSRIRRAIESGDIEKANAMLGYEFFYNGEIQNGKHLGRELGFPTINQYLGAEIVKPLSGVYLSRVFLNSKQYMGLTNIGENPTIGTDNFRSETYIFDFNENVYGKNATVSLKSFIRPEKKFLSLEELEQTVKNDIERARRKANV